MAEHFDYVIVGGGTAGAVLAARLSEDPSVRVLLIEAGGSDRTPLTRVPVGYVGMVQNQSYSWCYQTEPIAGLNGRRLMCPRGRVLGGSSSINGMIYVRGQHEDFDAWRAEGNVGWSHADLLPYFKKAFHQTRGADEHHGQGGPISVANCASEDSLSQAFLEACIHAGLPANPDFNGASQEGAGYYQFNIHRGERVSASRAYLEPARQRKNLRIETKSLVERVLFEHERAIGVAVKKGERQHTFSASREVIVCGGAINSPQLLWLSGIGPGASLSKLGIEVLRDLPAVGQNLQDHLMVRSSFAVSLPSMNALRSPLSQVLAFGRYALTKRGPLATGPCTVGAFFRTDATLTRPDAQIHFIPCSFDVVDDKQELHAFDGMTAGVYQLRPTSRGEVTLASADPRAVARIRPAHLETELDRETVVAALKRQRALLMSPRFEAVRGREISPGEQVTSDAEWLAFARETGDTSHHPVGTCRMGQDTSSVVDASLRVHGVERLRVVDASIMPSLISGNTHAATVAIAERAADLIRGRVTSNETHEEAAQ
jgi:choline dehydrogenase